MEIIPFEAEHAKEVYSRLVWTDFPDVTQPIQVPGMSFSAVQDGKVVGCAGLIPTVVPGIALAWMLLTWRAREEGLCVLANVHSKFPEVAARGPFHRVEAAVRLNWSLAERFVEKLGFVREGPLYCYDSQARTYTRYARIFPENLKN